VTSQLLSLGLLCLHAGCIIPLLVTAIHRRSLRRLPLDPLLLRAPELLFSLTAVLFLFTFIFATNANMDYVQRFMASHGNLRLAPNSTMERRSALLRFLPILSLDLLWYVAPRLARPADARAALGAKSPAGAWSLALAVLSGLLMAFSFPSFLSTRGFPVLGWVSLVPLFLCLAEAPISWGIFYGTLAGVLQTMVSNYWLGTFNLLTLQFVSVVTAMEYVPFMAAALLLVRRARIAGFLVFPAAWTVFDWLRSMGFLGYPWGMPGASQYSILPVIQVASLTGVWGVTFLVVLTNAVAAWYIHAALTRRRQGPGAWILLAAVLSVALGYAGVRAAQDARAAPADRSVRLALIQQNADPRKDDYREVFNILRRLTDQALPSNPDLVVWSETAFVPNIRRWSQEDPTVYPYAALVKDFLAYQRSLGRWLITGNDDYSLLELPTGEERLDYNGSVLFSPPGARVETYHKIHLVPFTEYFPYKKQLPGIYKLLLSFDAYLWEPGDRRVIFRIPGLAFSTPICFEDVFPDDVRRFVSAGADVILNLSNDYWSLTETEAMQHAANAVFRAVENGRPLARASASGLTCLIAANGSIAARCPFFAERSLVVDVPLREHRETLYTRWGDWFPAALAAFLLFLLAGSFAWRLTR
jgi:apolipoprotein N-acyltransferase